MSDATWHYLNGARLAVIVIAGLWATYAFIHALIEALWKLARGKERR